MMQLKVDHPLTVKATKPKLYPKIQRKNKKWLGQGKKREITWFYMYCRKYLTNNCKKMYKVWTE